MTTQDHLAAALLALAMAMCHLADDADPDPHSVSLLQDAMALLEVAGADPAAELSTATARLEQWSLMSVRALIAQASAELEGIDARERVGRIAVAHSELRALMVVLAGG